MSATKPKEKIETEANSLSVKLLKTLGGSATKDYSKKIITNLKDLSNRIKIANKQHQNKHPNKAIAEEWIREEGVDLALVKEQAIFTKEEEKKISIRMPIIVQEQSRLLQPTIKDLPFQQFSQKIEENFAYRAIFQSLTEQTKPKNEYERVIPREKNMKKIVKAHINRLCQYSQQARLLDEHKKSEKVSDGETIKAYQDVISQSDLNELSEMIFQRFHQDDHFSKCWVQLLYYQIEMAKQIYQDSLSSKDKSTFRLYLSAVSLEKLSKLFNSILKKNKAELIGKYKLEQNHSMAQDQWRQLYFMLRIDEKNNFLEVCQKIHPELGQNYQRLFECIESFEKAPLQITDIALNTQMNFFERIIKQIAEGQYESMPQAHPSLQALQQPWLILMALQFRQLGSRFMGTQRKDPLKQATTRYFRSLTQKMFDQEEYNEQVIMHLVFGLLSLSSFKQIFKLYDQLGEYLYNKPLYIDFVHVFVLLVANPQLLFCQLPELQANELLRRCLMEIIAFLKLLKNRRLPSFKAYLSLFLKTIANIQRLQPRFAFQTITDSLSKQLLTKLEDLKLIDKQNLTTLSQRSQVVHNFQRQLIRNIHPVNEKQFIQLAQFCHSLNQQTLQQQTLIKLIIYNYIQVDRQEKQIQRGVFATTAKTSASTLNTDAAKAQLFLQRQMREEKKGALNFLIDLKDLRSAVINRRKDILRKQEKNFAKYRQNFEDIFNYLIEMDPSYKQGLLDIYLLYIERLEQMYRLISLSNANLQKFYQERSSLANDLNVLKRRYPALHGQTYGRVIEILGR